MSKGKRRRRHSKAVQQTQPPAPSLPTPVTEPGRQRKRKRNHHKAKKRPLSSSQVYRKDGLNSESPQAGSSNHPPTDQERKNPRSVHGSQVKVQEQRSPAKRSTTPLQRAPKAKGGYGSDSEFEFEYINKAQAQLKPRVALRSPPSSPQKVVGPKKTTPVSGNERGNDVRATSADADSESEREGELASPSPSLPSPQRALPLENTTPVSNHDRQRTSLGASLSNATSESQRVFTPEPERGSSQSSGTSLERVVGHEEATPASYPSYAHRIREPSASHTDDEPENASEAEPGHGPEWSLSSSSPCDKTALKRKRPNAHIASRRKAAPLPAPSPLDCLPEVESEPTLPSMDNLTFSESALRNFRVDHWRKACEPKEPPLPSRSDLSKVIGPSSPSVFVLMSEFQPPESEVESRYASPSPTQITPASSPPVPPTVPRVRSRVRSRLPSPQRWLSRLGRPMQKPTLRETVWTSRLRPTCEIYFTNKPLLINSMRYPHLSAEFPPDAYGNPEFEFWDNSDDDSDFELPEDIEPPEAKRRRLWLSRDSSETELTERESSLEPEESSEPELFESSEPEAQIDLEPLLLDIAGSSDPQPLPELERSSDAGRSSNRGSEHPRPPTSIRDELPVRQSRQLNKRIDEAIMRDKEENPKFWGGSWMKEYERGVPIKERAEAEYKEEMARKKEEAERKKREKQERDRILKEKREKKRKEMAEQKARLEREKQKRMEEQERQQKERQKREELERRRARASAGKKPKNVESALQEMLDERETTDVEMSVDPEGLKVAQTAYRLYMRKKAR
ncbi:hypothetical protein N7524_001327 [Penicillium chrysogenum]|nr:hypothetical protein N7524_001327 [Penicillium chrysogenum]